MRRVEILTVVYETDREAADALIPEPLRSRAPRAALHVYWMHDAEWFGVYGESAVHLPVVLPDGRTGTYSPFLVLGSDGAVAAGREHYGQPKKHGEVELTSRGDLLVGVVARNGIEIATATMCFKQEPAAPTRSRRLMPGSALNVNLRVLPEEEGRFRRELVARVFEDVVVHEAWTGPGDARAAAERPGAAAPAAGAAHRARSPPDGRPDVAAGHHRAPLFRVGFAHAGRERRRDPDPRLADREAADDARRLPADAERPARGVQPVDQPRSGGRLRRRDAARGAGAARAPGLVAARERAAQPRRRSTATCSTRRSASSVPEQSVLAVLMLRGAQTSAELRARTERLHPFASRGRRRRRAGGARAIAGWRG